MVAVGVVAAPAVFASAPSRPVAGVVFGSILARFGSLELAFAALALVSLGVLLAAVPAGERPKASAFLCLVLVILTCVNTLWLTGAVAAERMAVPGFDALQIGHPSRARFERLHVASVRLGTAKLLLGLALLGMALRRPEPHAA
jgi:hypothetical protein